MFKFRLFFVSLAVTAGVLLAVIYVNRAKLAGAPRLNPVANGLFVTSQLRADNVRELKRRGFTNIVDLRPYGEDGNQAPSSEIRRAAEENGMAFHYIPVPHGDIPKDAVDALHDAISDQTARSVLYCRTGNRAVRTFALVEASRADGPSAAAIIQMVHDAGFSADDLKENINQRIARRDSAGEPKK